MKRHKKSSSLLAIVAGAAIVLTGCTGESDSGGAGGGDNGVSGGSEEVVFVDAIATNPAHLNVQLTTDVATRIIGSTMYEPLVYLDASYELHEALATDWQVNDEATEVTLTLREGVTWHDGEPFTSGDVKFNLEEVLPLHPLGVQLSDVQASVETPDAHTVVVKLNQPFAPYLAGLSSHYMLPAHIFQGSDITTNPVNSAPIGTGPFAFDEMVEGSHAQVVKNDEYWGEATNIDRVVFQIMPDANARVLALRAGQVDRITNIFLDAAQVGTLRDDEDLFFEGTSSLRNVMTLFFGSSNGPTANAKVRAALYRAIDREAIAENVYYGMAEPARGPIPSTVEWAADPSIDFAEQFAFDLDAAAEALDAAGFPADANGDRFEINIRVVSGLPSFTGTAEVIKSNFEEIGVGVNIIAEDLNVFIDQVYTQHNFDMAVMPFSPYEDPSLGVSRLYVCNPDSIPFRNPSLLCDEELDAFFEAAAIAADRDERAALFADAERRVAELLHVVPLVEEVPESVIRQGRWSSIEEFAQVIGYDWSKIRSTP